MFCKGGEEGDLRSEEWQDAEVGGGTMVVCVEPRGGV